MKSSNRLVRATNEGIVVHRGGPRAVPQIVWAPLSAGILVAILGAIAMWAGEPWLFASLGPTIYIQAAQPQLRDARIYNTIAGHYAALGAGLLAVWIFGVGHGPSAFVLQHLVWGQVFACALALCLMLLVQIPLRAVHPPAAATALLFGLGAFKLGWHDAEVVLIGVAVAAAIGEIVRRLRLMQPGQR